MEKKPYTTVQNCRKTYKTVEKRIKPDLNIGFWIPLYRIYKM